MSFDQKYYSSNKQNNDRLGLFFYSKVVNRYFNPTNVLDYGCGTGHFLKRLSKIKSVRKTFGLETSQYARDQVKINSAKSIIVSEINNIKEKSINLVTMLHVIEHLTDQELSNIFHKLKTVMTPDGIIMITTPAKNGLAHKIKKENWIGFKDNTHINLKKYNDWINFFHKNKIKLIKAGSDGLWDFPYKSLKNSFKILKILFIMTIQIILGKLYLSYNEGETFIFFLKFTDNQHINY